MRCRRAIFAALLVAGLLAAPVAPASAGDGNPLRITTLTACLGDGTGGLRWVLTLTLPELPEGADAYVRFSAQMSGALSQDLTDFLSPNGINISSGLLDELYSTAVVAAPGTTDAMVMLDAFAEIVFSDGNENLVYTAQGSAALPFCEQPVVPESTPVPTEVRATDAVRPSFTG